MNATRTISINQARLWWLTRELGIAAGLAGLTALAARVAIPLPWTPIPATLQVAAVLFAGAAAGPWRGAFSQVLVLALGLTGLPVFAEPLSGPAVALLPTFGYLLSFPVAAFLAGRWIGRRSRWMGAGAALLAIYGIGGLWLFGWALASGQHPSAAWTLWAGVLPFLPFDLLKAVLAMWSARPLRKKIG